MIGRIWVGLISILSLTAAATTSADSFSAANVAYEQGKFAEAAALYESVVTNRAGSAAAWFNLGNARFKAGELGRAIAAWRSAERLTPRDSSLRANLAFARRKAAGDQDVSPPAGEQLLAFFTPNEWAAGAAIGWMLFFAILAFTEWRAGGATFVRQSDLASPLASSSGRPRVALSLIGVGTVLLAGAAVMSYVDVYRTPEVVAVKQAAARLGPLDDSQIAFQVNDGSEFHVIDSTATWVQVEDKSGKVGWLKRGDVAFVSGARR